MATEAGKVRRFSLITDHQGCNARMERLGRGMYVRHTDYEAVEQRALTAEARIAELKAQVEVLSKDKERMDMLEIMAENGLVSMCFELDGGFHVTLEGVSDEPVAARNVDTIRSGIDWHIEDERRINPDYDAALAAEGEKDG